jgi:peptidoglycan/LPS O-acetylase OafA/YrhL
VPRSLPMVGTRGVDGMSGGPRLGYRPALDGVRGIAIAVVVAFHAFGWPAEGTLGVDLFFVLSGFLITTLLLEEHQATGSISIPGFYRRRARRLLPALFVLLTPFLLLAVIAAATTGSLRAPLFVGLASALTYTTNVFVAADPSTVPAAMIHLWSLAAEEQFYIVWPLFLLILIRSGGPRRVGRAVVVLLMVAVLYRIQLLMRGASIGRLYYAPDTHADSLLVGCAVGCFFARGRLLIWIRSSARMREVASVTTLTLIIAAVFLLDHVPQRLAYETLLLPTVFAVVAGLLIVCLMSGDTVVARGLSVRPIVFLGQISYSLYLWHHPLLVAFSGVDRKLGAPTVAAVALAVVLASCSRRFIELPFLRRRPEPPTERVASRPAPVPA